MLADMEREVRVRRKMCLLKGINNHPMIFGIGNMSTPGEISAFYVVVLDVSFHFKSLLEAIDTAFKMFNIFSIQYPPESSKVWSFLNEVFYQIESRGSPTIESIVSSFTKIIHWSNWYLYCKDLIKLWISQTLLTKVKYRIFFSFLNGTRYILVIQINNLKLFDEDHIYFCIVDLIYYFHRK